MDIKFDKMTVDTSLAQEYIKEDKILCQYYNDYSSTFEKFGTHVFDGRMFTTNLFKIFSNGAATPNEMMNRNTQRSLRDLALRLKQNANLFAQLEYVMRNIAIKDTNAQLNLIIQRFKYITPTRHNIQCETVQMKFDENLLYLGCVMNKLLVYTGKVNLVAVKATAFVSHLFVKLCHEVGLSSIYLQFVDDPPRCQLQRKKIKSEVGGLDSGTVAVVSEDADVDSAVDIFLSASKQAPWRLRRIIVQESIYQQFKDALRWKCNLIKQEIKVITSDVLCSDTLTYNGRVFVIDPVESSQDPSVVTIEAYRTRKEMISMLQKDEPRYLSFWVNDIAEINEVTHSTKSPVVWVNNLADFRGPPQISEAVYSYVFESDFAVAKCERMSKLCELYEMWLKLDIESRLNILDCALDKCMLSDSIDEEYFTELKNSLSDFTMKSFVHVGTDYVCVGMSKPVGIFGITTRQSFFTLENMRSILSGNAFAIYDSNMIFESKSEFDILLQAGVPVITIDGEGVNRDFIIKRRSTDCRIRAIWTNSGTIFAN